MVAAQSEFKNWHIRSSATPLEPIVEFGNNAKILNDPLADIRSVCSQTEPRDAALAVREITAIGAVAKNGRLYLFDHLLIKDAVHICQSWGALVSKDFVLRVMNLADDKKGDFLFNPIPTDLLVVC